MDAPVQDNVRIEKRTIDHIPVTERHGRAWNLFTIWFGSNIMLLTVATGVVATAVYGLPVWAAIASLVVGHVVGGVVMALHAAQGPQMGVPQMLQTRAQFGSYGSLLVVVLVILMYVGFFASNLVLGGQAVATLFGFGDNLAIVLIGLVSVLGAIVGYRLIHALAGVMSVVSGVVLVLAFVWALGVSGLPAGTLTGGDFSWFGFFGTLSLAALWQIAYAPYVSDYTRYMPRDTGVRPAFWATYSGAVLGSLFPMVLGRSEEHTSELQSRQYLVCRLLLEKKKTTISTRITGLNHLKNINLSYKIYIDLTQPHQYHIHTHQSLNKNLSSLLMTIPKFDYIYT